MIGTMEKQNGGIHRNVRGKGTLTGNHVVVMSSGVQSVR